MSLTEQKKDSPFLSKWREKIISRKLLLWLTTTAFFCFAMVTEDTWLLVSMIWLGMQGSLDFLKMWRQTKQPIEEN